MMAIESEHEEFEPDGTFEYDHKRKLLFAITLIGVIALIIAFVLVYIFSLQHIDFFLITWINELVNHVSTTMASMELAGMIYTSLLGGLFFIFVPLDLLLGRYITSGHSPVLIILFYLTGLVLSFTLNYHVGKRLSGLSKKLITTKKFYQIKSKLNRYGGITVFLFNVTPLPSPQLSAILGVFKYNKKRFYLYFLSGQLIKAIAIAILVTSFL